MIRKTSLALVTALIALAVMRVEPAKADDTLVITYRSPEDPNDTRYEYDNSLLKLALDKTVSKYGPYKLEPSPVMNFERAIYSLKNNSLKNFMVKLSYEDGFIPDMDYVPIPTDRGIVGYRVFFVSPQKKALVAQAKTLDDLKKFTIVQGAGWSDIKILEHNGLKVVTLPDYASLFPFVAAGRADILSRGTNEILDEYKTYKSQVKDLDYDRQVILYYPLPRFFFTSKGNEQAVKRITEGLEMAWADGSYQALWKSQYQESIDFVNIKGRTIISAENPLISTLGDGYKKYLYTPASAEH